MGYFVEYGPNSTRLQSSSDSPVFFEQILKEAKMKRSQLYKRLSSQSANKKQSNYCATILREEKRNFL